MTSRELIRELEAAGWMIGRIKGSHHQMVKDGRTVTVPHPKKDLPKPLVASIRRSAGLQ
jgi:predicted RNA binding protein YcfA (HicA-like mRNA interferase family)